MSLWSEFLSNKQRSIDKWTHPACREFEEHGIAVRIVAVIVLSAL